MKENRKEIVKIYYKTVFTRYNFIFEGIYCCRCANNLRHIYIALVLSLSTNSMRQMRHFIVRLYIHLNENVFAFHSSFTEPNVYTNAIW